MFPVHIPVIPLFYILCNGLQVALDVYKRQVQYCSNVSSNALLNYYIKLAQDQGIDVETSISLPPSLPVPEIDFCTILGNLLSNAVESRMRQTCGPASIAINICLLYTSRCV